MDVVEGRSRDGLDAVDIGCRVRRGCYHLSAKCRKGALPERATYRIRQPAMSGKLTLLTRHPFAWLHLIHLPLEASASLQIKSYTSYAPLLPSGITCHENLNSRPLTVTR